MSILSTTALRLLAVSSRLDDQTHIHVLDGQISYLEVSFGSICWPILVERIGVEPMTLCLQSRCSTN